MWSSTNGDNVFLSVMDPNCEKAAVSHKETALSLLSSHAVMTAKYSDISVIKNYSEAAVIKTYK